MTDFNKKAEEAFRLLDEKLGEESLTLTVICVGGFVLSRYGVRATKDIDGFFKSTDKVNRVIREVGDMLNLNLEDELWLNNSVQNLNAWPPEDICDTLCKYENLTVLVPPLAYIAGMKIESARGQDIQDVADILNILKPDSPVSFAKVLEGFGFHPDESLLLEAFGMAYGMAWLEKYFTEHEAEILEKL